MNKEGQSIENTSQQQETDEQFFKDETISQLSEGCMAKYKPHLQNTKKQLDELNEKQNVLIEQLHNENLKVSWTQNSVDLHKMFDVIGTYQIKLSNIKKEMRVLHDKSMKLKKRAIRLQQLKEKNEYLLQQQKELELKREQDLIGK